MQVLKTPENAFACIKDFPYAPQYVDVTDTISSEISMAYYQVGPKDGPTILLLHGEPTWAYLYRKMMPILADAGFNVLAPDLIGFGRSDKPTRKEDYSYTRHTIWLKEWFNQVVKGSVTLFCQDWGGLLGLRLVADMPERFSGVMVANTGLPTGEHPPSDAFINWRRFSQHSPELKISSIVEGGTVFPLEQNTRDAYDAPFPSEDYKAGARAFPLLVPVTVDSPGAHSNRAAWEKLKSFSKPFATAFSDSDPITAGGEALFKFRIPGCEHASHTTIKDGGHFVQEDKGEELAHLLIQFINQTHKL